jgi:hypothetical protein
MARKWVEGGMRKEIILITLWGRFVLVIGDVDVPPPPLGLYD